MLERIAIVSIACMIILSVNPGLGGFSEVASPTREMVNSRWTQTPPTIDGAFKSGEWANPQIVMNPPAYPLESKAYFYNDALNLYVLVDSLGDQSNEKVSRDGRSYVDESLLVFNFVNSVPVQIKGVAGDKLNGGFRGAIGFSNSPDGIKSHKIFEFSIPLTYIRASPGLSIDVCSPPGFGGIGKGSIAYDSETEKDNIWPIGLVLSDINTWAILAIAQASQAVPEFPGGFILAISAAFVSCLVLLRFKKSRGIILLSQLWMQTGSGVQECCQH